MNPGMKLIKIADYSVAPAGQKRGDGPHSGEWFREEVILPALKEYQTVVINLDGTLGFSATFLKEAFGGLIAPGRKASDLHKHLQISSELDSYKERVWRYIDEATPKEVSADPSVVHATVSAAS